MGAEIPRICDNIAGHLLSAGVRHVFGLVGGGAAGLNDAFAKLDGKIKYVSFHHEQGAAHAAIGYAKQTNGIAVVNPTTGCGGTNCITSVLDAWQDSVPVLFLSGNVGTQHTMRWLRERHHISPRQLGMQEANIIELVRPITKLAHTIDDPASALYWLQHAINVACAPRAGPVWLDVPSDIQNARMPCEDMRILLPTSPCSAVMDVTDVRALLNNAQRPLVLAGNGVHCSKAKKLFNQFIHSYQLPVVTTFLGIDLMDSDDPLHIGRVGVKGDRAGNFAVQNCDMLLVLGCSLNVAEVGYDRTLFAAKAKICVVDIDPEHCAKIMPIHRFTYADISEFLRGML